MSKYGVFSGPYFPAFRGTLYLSVFSPNAEKYGPEKTPCLDTFHAVIDIEGEDAPELEEAVKNRNEPKGTIILVKRYKSIIKSQNKKIINIV